MADDVQQIKDRLSITDVVSDYVELKQAGQYLKAKSPFTDERNPSFYVSPEKGLYHCFSSGKGGDIFTFVQEMEGVEFREALEILADRAGVQLSGGDGGGQKKRLREITATARDFFADQLTDNQKAQSYLQERGITKETADTFNLGYAPDAWRKTITHLKDNGFTTEDIIAAGLAKQPNENKSPYDRFRNRIMFPIRDPAGRVIAFSGRRLDPDDPAKYINSPETPLFRKKEVLFGFHLAKSSLRELDAAVLVEGQTDLVLSYQAGCKNVVASSGTAVTGDHLDLIQRFTDNLILALDTDEAGRASTLKTAQLALSQGMTPKVADLPAGMDPADVVTQQGSQTLQEAIAAAEHVITTAVRWADTRSADRRQFLDELQNQVFPLIRNIDNALSRDHFTRAVADQAGIREKTLRKELNKNDRRPVQAQQSDVQQAADQDSLLTRAERKREIEKELRAIQQWQQDTEEPMIQVDDLEERITSIKDREIHAADVDVADDDAFAAEVKHQDKKPEQLQKTVEELLLHFEEIVLQQAYELAQAQIARTDDTEEKQTLLEKCQKISARIQEIRTEVRDHT